MNGIIDCNDQAQLRSMSSEATLQLARIDWTPLVGTMSEVDLNKVLSVGSSWSREVCLHELARREHLSR